MARFIPGRFRRLEEARNFQRDIRYEQLVGAGLSPQAAVKPQYLGYPALERSAVSNPHHPDVALEWGYRVGRFAPVQGIAVSSRMVGRVEPGSIVGHTAVDQIHHHAPAAAAENHHAAALLALVKAARRTPADQFGQDRKETCGAEIIRFIEMHRGHLNAKVSLAAVSEAATCFAEGSAGQASVNRLSANLQRTIDRSQSTASPVRQGATSSASAALHRDLGLPAPAPRRAGLAL